MELFFEIHRDLPREGPGDDLSTTRAFSRLEGLPAQPRILDIGCGPGMQTRQLARLTSGSIAAVDTTWHFLRDQQRLAAAEGLSARIRPIRMSMFDLGFPPASFDLIWSEGAIYIHGFEQGLRAFRPLLKPGGFMAVTELSWLRPDPPETAAAFWRAGYPGMASREENERIVRAAGFELLESFVLPDSAWFDHYYRPMEKRLAMLREKYAGRADVLAVLDAEQEEIGVFEKYSAWYGYVFYIMRKDEQAQ